MDNPMFYVGFIALVLLILMLRKPKSEPSVDFEKSKKVRRVQKNRETKITSRDLLTRTEIKFFHYIESILPKGYRIFPQVSFNAFIHSDDLGSRNEFNRKSCDMLLCDTDLNTIAVIEVDDPKSHNSKRARENDAKRDQIVAEAGYPTLRINNNDTERHIKKIIHDAIKKNPH